MVPPSERSRQASASVIAREPPSATGQPCRCPAAISIVPTAAVSGRSSGRKTWAAQPANSARAGVGAEPPGEHRGRQPGPEPEPAPAAPGGAAGAASGRARRRRASSKRSTSGPKTPRHAVAVDPEPGGGVVERARPAPPPCRRRAGARGRSPASARPGRGRRAAATRGTASRRRTGGPPSRRRAGRPARSAPRCGCRRRSCRAPRAR